jgi:DNA polymerase (family 10)
MAISNGDIAELFEKLGALLEMKGDSVFKVRAYRRAAQTISRLSFPVSQAVAEGADLKEIPGIGKALNDKIHELLQTGRVAAYEKLVSEMGTREPEQTKGPDDRAMRGGRP